MHEDLPLWPISPYGASKLGCEAMISAYCHMFGMRALALRFANVVGPNQTHGVAYDFIRRLREDPSELTILGDGSQSKSYVHVDDVVDALVGLFPAGDRSLEVAERRHRGLPDACSRSPTWWWSGSACRTSSTASARARAAGRATCRWCASTARRARARGWSNARTSREAMAASIDAMIAQVEDEEGARG